MVEVLREYLPVILIAVLIGAIIGFLMFRPRQRVELTESAPQRPHMAYAARPPAGEDKSIAGEIAAAASDVAGGMMEAPVHENLPGASGPPDNLQRLKGVGPKFADVLNARGIVRFEQLARLNPHEVERLDAHLGPFRGRLERDRIVEQADYLSRGDEEGFEYRFGKL